MTRKFCRGSRKGNASSLDKTRRGVMSASSSGSEIEEEVIPDALDASSVEFTDGPDVTSTGDAEPDALNGSGGESPEEHGSDKYSDDFGSDGGGFLDEPVDEAPESPRDTVDETGGGFTGSGDTSADPVPTSRTASGEAFNKNHATRGNRGDAHEKASSDTSDSGEFGKVFKWETSPDTSMDAFAVCSSEQGPKRTVRDPKWANPSVINKLVARAQRLAARREQVAATPEAQRRERRYAEDKKYMPVTVGPLTIAKARAANSTASLKKEADAIAKDISILNEQQRKRMTPSLAKAMYIRRAIIRAQAADGARLSKSIEEESDGESNSEPSTLRVLQDALGKGFEGGDTPTEEETKTNYAYPALGKGKQALLRRLWASHSLRRDAAEALVGDADARTPPPNQWTELSLGAAKDDGEGEWWDEDTKTWKPLMDVHAETEAGGETVAMLRESAELRRRAREIL